MLCKVKTIYLCAIFLQIFNLKLYTKFFTVKHAFQIKLNPAQCNFLQELTATSFRRKNISTDKRFNNIITRYIVFKTFKSNTYSRVILEKHLTPEIHNTI